MRIALILSFALVLLPGCARDNASVFSCKVDQPIPFRLMISICGDDAKISTNGLLGISDGITTKTWDMPVENLTKTAEGYAFATPFGVPGKALPIAWRLTLLNKPTDSTWRIILDDIYDDKPPKEYLLSVQGITSR